MDTFDNTTHEQFAGLWRKSTRSDGNGACVEVADAAVIGVADSKQGPTGDVLVFGRTSWTAFLQAVKGEQGTKLA